MRLMPFPIFLIFTLVGCGSEPPSESMTLALTSGEGFFRHNTLGEQDSQPADEKLGFTVSANVDFRYERSEPTYVNGRPQRGPAYWSCVRQVVARFSRPVSYVSLLGAVVGKGSYVTDRPFSVTNLSADGKVVTLTPSGTKGMCARNFAHTQILFGSAIRDVSGNRLVGRTSVPIAYGPGTNELKEVDAELPEQPFRDLVEPDFAPRDTGYSSSEHLAANKESSICERRSGKQCLVNLSPSSTLTTKKINTVYQRLAAWREREESSAVYRRESIQRLQTADTIIVPRGPNSTERHYGLPDVLYTVREASKFVEYLFPGLESIGVADLSTPEGDTPYTAWPDGSRQYLHPFGSHQGQDVDIGYISVGTGNERKSAIDIEKSFWLLYAALQSAGVDLVYTAHKDEFVEYARKARDRGLINDVAYGRFQSARIIKDQNLGHDTHFHFKVSYRDYQGESLRFEQSNDVYNCLLGLGRAGNSEQNFCRSL